MDKRGISPLIATILLIFIVVFVAFLVMTFYKDLVKGETEKTSTESSISNYCLQGVDLEFVDLCEYGSDLSLKIKNRANGDILGFNILVVDDTGTHLTEINDGLGGLSSSRYALAYGGFPDQVDKVIVTPLVDVGNCPKKDFLINSVNICCLDLDGDTYDSCDIGDSPEDDGKTIDCDDGDETVWEWFSNVYLDEDGDGAFSERSTSLFCASGGSLGAVGGFSNSAGSDCVDVSSDCDFPPHASGESHTSCLANLPRIYKNSLLYAGDPIEDTVERCTDKVDNDCNGLIDGEDNPSCYPICSHGDMHSATYPCRCDLGGMDTLFEGHSSNCEYCCNGACMDVDCDTIPEL